MNLKNLTICLTLAVLLGSAGTSWGADFEKGFAAAQSGDFATALREWKPLAEQGNVAAQYKLGLMYHEGVGVPQDYETAVKWYTLAAEQGHASAQYNLGWMYDKGDGIPRNRKTAVKWYTLAAEQGDADAQYQLGVINYFGVGILIRTPTDYVYAHMWGHIAASNGHEIGGKLRDAVAKEMTAAQIEKAQELARECVAKKYKGC